MCSFARETVNSSYTGYEKRIEKYGSCSIGMNRIFYCLSASLIMSPHSGQNFGV